MIYLLDIILFSLQKLLKLSNICFLFKIKLFISVCIISGVSIFLLVKFISILSKLLIYLFNILNCPHFSIKIVKLSYLYIII
jgi:hypothetical protein